MRRWLLPLLLLIAVPARAANSVYIAQAAAGGNTGLDCADAFAVSYFNNAANWSATPTGTQIGPATTVHLCGSFVGSAGQNSLIQFQGSGSSGNPVTLLWEAGANVQAPYFGTTGAVDVNTKSYITLNGGANGIVENTANGTSLTYQQASTLVGRIGSNFTMENLTVGPVYVHLVSPDDSGGGNAYGVSGSPGISNITIGPGNVMTECNVCVLLDFGAGAQSGLTVFNSNFTESNQYIEVGFFPAGTFNNILIYGNTGGGWDNWDDVGNDFHHNFFHAFTNLPGAAIGGTLEVYNNQMVGSLGSHATSMIFLENNNGGSGGTMGTWYLFNNVLYKTNANVPTSEGLINPLPNGGYAVNNTMIDAGGSGADLWNCFALEASGWTVENNIEQGCSGYMYQSVAGYPTANHNIYYGAAAPQWVGNVSVFYTNLAAWQAGCSCDANSSTSNPLVNLTNYHLGGGSPAIGAGANLTSLSITALDSDAGGTMRPSGATPWDIGAFQFGAATGTGNSITKNIKITANVKIQ